MLDPISIFESPVNAGAFGALALNFIELVSLRNGPKKNRYILNDWIYWVNFFCMPIISAILVAIYVKSGNKINPILGLNIGITAPLIIRSMATKRPINPGEGASMVNRLTLFNSATFNIRTGVHMLNHAQIKDQILKNLNSWGGLIQALSNRQVDFHSKGVGNSLE